MKRKEKILELINKNRYLTLDELVDYLGVSINTVRKDVDDLSIDEKITKVKGGSIICNDYKHYKNNIDLFRKQEIGKLAASFINDGESVAIDGGTTTKQIIPFLENKKDLVIHTQSLDIAYEISLLNNPTFTLITSGGVLDYKVNIFTNEQSEKEINEYNFDKGFLSSSAIDITNGVTNIELSSAKYKNIIIKNSKTCYFIFDSTKFGKISLMKICDITKIQNIIVDSGIKQKYLEDIRKIIPNVYMANINR